MARLLPNGSAFTAWRKRASIKHNVYPLIADDKSLSMEQSLRKGFVFCTAMNKKEKDGTAALFSSGTTDREWTEYRLFVVPESC